LFPDLTIYLDHIIEDDKASTMVIWAHGTANTPAGPYTNEYAIFLWFNEDGTQVKRFVEMVDSASSSDFFPRLAKTVDGKEVSSMMDRHGGD
jgi:hypothetical protein